MGKNWFGLDPMYLTAKVIVPSFFLKRTTFVFISSIIVSF
jgi:hypothetical protein